MTKEKFKLSTARGFRDFPPNEKILRDQVINQIKDVFEAYGFSPLETPTIERLDVLTAKFGAGEASDIVGELYQLKDQGGRDLGLRYEFTFALARYIGMNPQTKLPFKRYQIGPVFRDGPIKAGRYREFYQCDVDTVGAKGIIADAEIISLLGAVFKKLNLEINIEVNDRKLLEDIFNYLEIKENQESIIVTIDKLKKIGREGVSKELKEKELQEDKINKLLDIVLVKGNNLEKLDNIKKIITETEGVKELQELFNYLEQFEVDYTFLPSLARGLGYYTGPIFEVFLKDQTIISSSLAGGGRWDKMIGKYLGNDKLAYPATGVAVGLEPTMEIIKKIKGLPSSTKAKILLIPIKTIEQCIKISKQLREDGIKTMLDLMNRNIGKNLDYADKMGIPFVGILGENELKENKIKIKNMKTGEEQLVFIKEIKNLIK